VLDAGVPRASGSGIVYSSLEVKNWDTKAPDVEQVRPGRCSRCGAGSRPPGRPLGLVGHGCRERQVRGPATVDGPSRVVVVQIRRYRCRHCGGLTTVLPRGLCARRHYAASAIGLALYLFGVLRLQVGAVRARICSGRAGFETERWSTLFDWLGALRAQRLFACVRGSPPSFSARDQAARAAHTLAAFSASSPPSVAHPSSPVSMEGAVFSGAARAA
jgi:hypothetical protein